MPRDPKTGKFVKAAAPPPKKPKKPKKPKTKKKHKFRLPPISTWDDIAKVALTVGASLADGKITPAEAHKIRQSIDGAAEALIDARASRKAKDAVDQVAEAAPSTPRIRGGARKGGRKRGTARQ